MPTIQEKLETLFAKVRTLPEQRQEAALDALAEIAEDVYARDEDEPAIPRPALNSDAPDELDE